MILGLFIGLVIGVLIAFGVVWYLNKTPLPFQNKVEGPSRNEPKSAAQPGAPQPLPGKPGDKVGEKPRFQFYDILEGKQAGAQQPAPATGSPAAVPPAPTLPPAEQPRAPVADAVPVPTELFYLQAGAFQKPADADNLKAKLALTGMDVQIQDVAVADKGTLHRVRVGPFRSPEEMNKARTQLAQGGLQTTVVKVKVEQEAPR